MYFNKYPYRSNFEYLNKGKMRSDKGAIKGSFKVTDFNPRSENPYQDQDLNLQCQRYEGDIYYVTITSRKWNKNYSQSDLQFPEKSDIGETDLKIDDCLNISLEDAEGSILLDSAQGKGFGICGNESIYIFNRKDTDRFYGMGEKMLGLELSDRQTKFWNTDLFADFSYKEVRSGEPDPLYLSVPYLIIKRGRSYIGLLLDNPYATFIDTSGKISISGQMEVDENNVDTITMGSEHGQPNLIVIYGPTLAQLTKKMQTIVGKTPLPPVWALGYHQCRWGYGSNEDLKYLDSAMNRFEIPCDGLWLDIGYMDEYRVFTFDEKNNFPDPEKNLKEIQEGGRKIVPIIDPGVKKEIGYPVYESGKNENIFCKNPQGKEFIGLVWPGETVFPDYSTEKGRAWWAGHVKSFAERGIYAAWLDMNDPSVGSVLCTDMLFDNGKNSHYTFHNQYALSMAKATRDGFLKTYPENRPFLLSRSGFTGSNKYTAIWTGDNISNYHHLQKCIPCSINLALSGIPFNGPDVGGFDKDASAQLMIDWFKTSFLFPFFRNHSIFGSENQEPWAFDNKTLQILRYYIRFRYQMRPYLYNLFIEQEKTGDAILRPLFYDFDNSETIELDRIEDQFMVGSAVMQAPFVEEDTLIRNLILPDSHWYSPIDKKWIEGNVEIKVGKSDLTTPVYFREGSIVPMVPEVLGDHLFNPKNIRFHLFFSKNKGIKGEYLYTFDDGCSYGYKSGKRSSLKLSVNEIGGDLIIDTESVESGYGSCSFDFVLYDSFDNVIINGEIKETVPAEINLAGIDLNLELV